MIAGSQTIADDRRRSQKIEHGSIIFCDRLRSRSQDRRRSQTIAEVGFHMIADDRRTFCDLRSAIRDRLRSYGNQPLGSSSKQINFVGLSCRNIFSQVLALRSNAHTTYILPMLLKQTFKFFLKSRNLKELMTSPKTHSTATATSLIPVLYSSIKGVSGL